MHIYHYDSWSPPSLRTVPKISTTIYRNSATFTKPSAQAASSETATRELFGPIGHLSN